MSKIYCNLENPVRDALEQVLKAVGLSFDAENEEATIIIVQNKVELMRFYDKKKQFIIFTHETVNKVPENACVISTHQVPRLVEKLHALRSNSAVTNADTSESSTRIEYGIEYIPEEGGGCSTVLGIDDSEENLHAAHIALVTDHKVTLANSFS